MEVAAHGALRANPQLISTPDLASDHPHASAILDDVHLQPLVLLAVHIHHHGSPGKAMTLQG